GGFRERAIYRVTVLPLFRDRYGNGMDGPVELLFSTGPELEPNLLAGIVSDFLTLDPVAGVRVDAVPAEGGPISSAVADSAGIFAFPHLPSGPYRIRAYED